MYVSVALQSKNETIQSRRVPHKSSLPIRRFFKQLSLDIFIVIIALSRVSAVVAFVIAMFNDLLYGDYYCVFTCLPTLWCCGCVFAVIHLSPPSDMFKHAMANKFNFLLRCTFSTTVIYLDYWTFVCVCVS